MADKRFLFTVELGGFGETAEEAWQNAIDAFCEDPGEPQSTTEEWTEE